MEALRKKLIFFAVFLFVFFLISSPGVARGGPRIRDVKVEIENEEIVVSARMTGGFRKEVLKEIHNGIPKEFYYYLLLKRKEQNWFDREILAKTILYTVKYDILKKNYKIIQKDGDKVTEKQANDFEAMKKIVSQVNQIVLAPVKLLQKRHRYYASVKSQMKTVKMPLYLDYFLFFIPLLELDTPWADSAPIVARPGK